MLFGIFYLGYSYGVKSIKTDLPKREEKLKEEKKPSLIHSINFFKSKKESRNCYNQKASQCNSVLVN